MRKFGLIILGVLILAGLAIYTMVFTVSEREYAIVTRFGRQMQTIDKAGPYIKWGSICDTVIRIDKRLAIFQTRPIELLLGDKNPIILTCYVCWHVKDPVAFYSSLSTPDNANLKLRDTVQSSLGSVLSAYKLNDIVSIEPDAVRLRKIEAETLADFKDKVEKEYGLTVRQLGIRRIAYPPMVTQAVHNRMRSEREKEAKKYRGEGREKAAKIEAETDTQVGKINAEASRIAEVTRGEGDGEATRIYADAYSQDREFFRFLRSLESYREILGKRATVVLSTKSSLFRFLTPEGALATTSQPATQKDAAR